MALRNHIMKMRLTFLFGAVITLLMVSVGTSVSHAEPVQQADHWTNHAGENSWPMAGANPQRTSASAEEVAGALTPTWFTNIEPYISQKTQLVAAYNQIYVSTAKGIYALDAQTGKVNWTYATDLPIGHSPTIHEGVVYAGGLDHKVHAVDAFTGGKIWTFTADAGFQTSPVVANNKVMLGNRDGYFYAIHATGGNAGQLAWRFKTDGPILYSAALNGSNIYFASNDSHAYALNVNTGGQIWKSAKLPGGGFTSWWPVVYGDQVIFSSANNYRTSIDPGPAMRITQMELQELYPNFTTDPKGELIGSLGAVPGNWADGTPTVDATRIINYLNAKPWRKSVFVLSAASGAETHTAPVLWAGTHSGTRYPPAVGPDNVLYQQNSYMSDAYIAGGHIAGWVPGNQHISVISMDWTAIDEPTAYAFGGNVIHWNLCCDRESGAMDVSQPATNFTANYNNGQRPPTLGWGSEAGREWPYFVYNLAAIAPGYDNLVYSGPAHVAFGNNNGTYGNHGDVNPPVPYKGMVYTHRGNTIIAFNQSAGAAAPSDNAKIAPAGANAQLPNAGRANLENRLATEVQKILDAGHLQPGYANHGIMNMWGRYACGDELSDYFHQSGETFVALLSAYPHLSPAQQGQVNTYLANEYANYAPYNSNHVGWDAGASRSFFDLPPEVIDDLTNHPKQAANYVYQYIGGAESSGVWGVNPYAYYALWKYAAHTGNAAAIYTDANPDLYLSPPPADSVLLTMPHVHNAFIAGYMGFLELEKLAGQPVSADKQAVYDHLLNLRRTNFTKESPYQTSASQAYCNSLNSANNFMYMVPELADYLRPFLLPTMRTALDEYVHNSPYWFVSFAHEGLLENAVVPLYDTHSIFMARAHLLGETGNELERYLDVPGFAVGDLYYIQKLTTVLDNYNQEGQLTYLPLMHR